MKSKILFLLRLPPPVDSITMTNLFIKESLKINEAFSCEYMNILVSNKISNIGKVKLSKLVGIGYVWFRLFFYLLRNRPDIVYMTFTTKGSSFYKDILFLTLLKIFRVKRVLHLHTKGIQEKHLNKLLYRFAFRGAQVILFSEDQLPDISGYVTKQNIHICHNGIPYYDEYF